MKVDTSVGVTSLGEDDLEKISDRYDTSWALIYWFCTKWSLQFDIWNDQFDVYTDDHFDLMPEWSNIPVVNILSLFEFELLLLFDWYDWLFDNNEQIEVVLIVIFFCKLRQYMYVSLYICVVVAFHNELIAQNEISFCDDTAVGQLLARACMMIYDNSYSSKSEIL